MRNSCLLFALIVAMGVFSAGTSAHVLPVAAIIACAGCLLAGIRIDRKSNPAALMGALLILFIALTAIPLPSLLDGLLGHIRSQPHDEARQAIMDSAKLSLSQAIHPWFALTRDRAATFRILLLAITALAMAMMAASLPKPWPRRLLELLVLFVTAVAILGFLGQHVFLQGKTIWWLSPVPHGQPVGPFLNRNHFGGFIALLCPAAIHLFFESLREKRYSKSTLWALCFLAISAAVVMSLSRGAWLAYAAAIFAVIIVSLATRRFAMSAVIICLLALVFWGVGHLPHDDLEDKIDDLKQGASSTTAEMRISTWKDTVRIIPDYAFIGVGANAFRSVFPQYRSATTRKSFKHAENEYFQVPAELGLIGTCLLLAFGWRLLKSWRLSLTDPGNDSVIKASAAGALIVAAVHAMFDFPARIPLYGIVLSVLAGLALATGRVREPAAGRAHLLSLLVPLAGIIAAITVALRSSDVYTLDSPDYLQTAKPKDLCRAIAWSPTSWQAWYHLGRAAAELPDARGMKFGEYCISRAAEYDPNNYQLWRELCLMRVNLDDREGAAEAYSRLKGLRTWQTIKEMESR